MFVFLFLGISAAVYVAWASRIVPRGVIVVIALWGFLLASTVLAVSVNHGVTHGTGFLGGLLGGQSTTAPNQPATAPATTKHGGR